MRAVSLFYRGLATTGAEETSLIQQFQTLDVHKDGLICPHELAQAYAILRL